MHIVREITFARAPRRFLRCQGVGYKLLPLFGERRLLFDRLDHKGVGGLIHAGDNLGDPAFQAVRELERGNWHREPPIRNEVIPWYYPVQQCVNHDTTLSRSVVEHQEILCQLGSGVTRYNSLSWVLLSCLGRWER